MNILHWESLNITELIEFIKMNPFNAEAWQALGQGYGWGHQVCRYCGYPALDLGVYCDDCDMELSLEEYPEWEYHALRYFELKLSGGDENEFWQNLISTKK